MQDVHGQQAGGGADQDQLAALGQDHPAQRRFVALVQGFDQHGIGEVGGRPSGSR